MDISSRTPEGCPNVCPICRKRFNIEPSPGSLDAPCPHCGHLLWFACDSTVIAPLLEQTSNSPAELQPADLSALGPIPDEIIKLVPELVARECHILPLSESQEKLVVAVSHPLDFDSFEKLRFFLNRQISIVHGEAEWIERNIDHYYGRLDSLPEK